jgi:tetratricopeptide (TPR) repeat protein
MTTLLLKRLSTFTAAATLAMALSLPALAAGGGGNSGGGNTGGAGNTPSRTETTEKCKNGKMWSTAKKKCVKPSQTSFNDDQLYDAAREMAYAGQYDNAIAVLKLARNQNDPRILNYMGYSNRKAGRMELGMSYYKRALAIDPNFVLARSYMGQALLLQGDVQGARTQLVEIRDRGGQDTYAYKLLYNSLKHSNTY